MANDRKMITFLGKERTKERLEFLARLTERSQSAYLRWIIDREYQQVSTHLPDNGNQLHREETS